MDVVESSSSNNSSGGGGGGGRLDAADYSASTWIFFCLSSDWLRGKKKRTADKHSILIPRVKSTQQHNMEIGLNLISTAWTCSWHR